MCFDVGMREAFNTKLRMFIKRGASLSLIGNDVISKWLHSKKMLACFTPTLGQMWTNPAIGLHFLITFFNVCPYLTQNWVKTTQHF